MASLDYNQIIKMAASTENTEELQSYWEKRYTDLVSKNYFQLSAKTIELISNEEMITRPATPFGDLVLDSHLDKNNNLDEITLQSSIESSVRFLDSLLDRVKFVEEARKIVNQYRKIGLGISNFKEYLAKKHITSELEEIDYIGNLISNGAYRASESLAEEKGACTNWSLIKKQLKPKSFEYWYNVDTGEIKSGLELVEDFDAESIKNSNFEIVPRRNSNILLFPPDIDWQIWGDREVPTSVKPTEERQGQEAQPTPTPANTEQTASQTKPELSAPQVTITPETGTKTPEFSNPKTELPQGIPSELATKVFDSFDQFSVPMGEEEEEIADIPQESSEIMPKGETTMQATEPVPTNTKQEVPQTTFTKEENDKVTESTQPTTPPETALLAQPEVQPTALTTVETEVEPLFQIGELVQVINDTKPDFNKVYQIIEVNQEGNEFVYRLTGGQTQLENQVWEETELQPVELTDILEKINIPQEVPAPHKVGLETRVNAVIINQDKILLQQAPNGWELPGGELIDGKSPEESLKEVLNRKYGLRGTTTYDIGSTIHNDDQAGNILLLAHVFTPEAVTNSGLSWVYLSQMNIAKPYVKTFVDKYNQHKEFFESKIKASLPVPAPVPSTNISTQNIHLNKQFMSKYTLKLEQIINSGLYGDLALTLRYDAEGARVVEVSNPNLPVELRQLLDIVLSLVNLSLSKKATPKEIAEYLAVEPKDGAELPINTLLKLLADSLKEAPDSVQTLTSAILG